MLIINIYFICNTFEYFTSYETFKKVHLPIGHHLVFYAILEYSCRYGHLSFKNLYIDNILYKISRIILKKAKVTTAPIIIMNAKSVTKLV